MSRLIGADNRAFRGFQRISLPVLLGSVAMIGAVAYERLVLEEGRGLATLPASAPGAPNVLLIVLDTVRADRLSLYGYDRDTTPNLTRLARRGVVFGEARSAAPWTLPSHASLFTGRWPHELNVSGDRRSTAPFRPSPSSSRSTATRQRGSSATRTSATPGTALTADSSTTRTTTSRTSSSAPARRCAAPALGRCLIRLVGTAYNVRPETANSEGRGAGQPRFPRLARRHGGSGRSSPSSTTSMLTTPTSRRPVSIATSA